MDLRCCSDSDLGSDSARGVASFAAVRSSGKSIRGQSPENNAERGVGCLWHNVVQFKDEDNLACVHIDKNHLPTLWHIVNVVDAQSHPADSPGTDVMRLQKRRGGGGWDLFGGRLILDLIGLLERGK